MLGSRVSRTRPVRSYPRKAASTARAEGKHRVGHDAPRRAVPVVQPVAASAHRSLALLVCIVLIAGGLGARLAFWQIMQHGHLARIAAAQRESLVVQPAMRGQIFDARGTPLATDVTMHLVYAVPTEIRDPGRTADLLAPILHQPAKRLDYILASGATYAQLAPIVTNDISNAIRRLKLPGIFLEPQVGRYYPEDGVAAHVLGFLNPYTGQGNYGLEGYYDRLLSGKAGLRSVLKDTAGNYVHLTKSPPSPSQAGFDLHLSLDSVVQSIAETLIDAAVKKHSALDGSLIVMDPKTGYILAMASTPGFNPNHYGQADPANFRNPALEWAYEPGSTFKVLTMAAGLDSGVITPTTAFLDTGQFPIGGQVLHNWNERGFGWETMTQVLQHSANVGASFVAGKLGTSRFYSYVKRFGIGQPTGIDLADEQSGLLPLPGDKSWTIVNQYTNSFGQALAVTPMQLLRAVGAVANNGVMMKPQIVRSMVYGNHIFDRPPVAQGRVISRSTAHTLTSMLVHSAVDGEAQAALVKGYNIAAKTGTANIPGPDGRYIPNETIASIVGYAPAENPKFIALVILNRPKDTIWGSVAAAPVLHDLFQQLFFYYHIPPAAHPLN